MRAASVGLSMIVHAGLVLAAWRSWPRATRATTTPGVVAVAPAPPPAPLEIELVTFATQSTPGAAAGAGAHQRATRHGAALPIRASASGPAAEAGPEPQAPSRAPGPLQVEGVLERIADHGDAPEMAPPPPLTGLLRDAGHGRQVHHDDVTTMTIDRDGTAHFHDSAAFDIHFGLRLPRPGAREADSTMWIPLPLIYGRSEITDWLMRATGVGDPYASRKLALLDATREERAARAQAAHAEDLARASELVRRNLEALWVQTREPAARRAALFALWDECAEGDGSLGEAGERARAQVIGWIRARLPAGSAEAFTPDDVAALDAHRSSQQHFTPYDDVVSQIAPF